MSGTMDIVQGIGSTLLDKGRDMINQYFPPEKRAELMGRLQAFAATNPKVAVSHKQRKNSGP